MIRSLVSLAGLCILIVPASAMSSPTAGASRAEAIADDVMNRLWDQIDPHFHKGETMHILNLNTMIMAGRPHRVEAFANQGYLLWGLGRESEAVTVFEEGMRKNPNSWFLFDDVAQYWLVHRKDYNKAIRYYEKAVTMPGATMFTSHGLARAYEKAGRVDQAVKLWTRLAENPNDPAAKANLNRLRNKVGPGNGQNR